jgi:GTP-binding protein
MIRLTSVKFVKSVVDLAHLPHSPVPEIAWAGRSNVGKSSLINAVVGKKNLARTSNTPGKTREINFYLINSNWHLVDLPGYGFAAGPDADRLRWQALIEPYLKQRSQLCGVAVLVDARIGPTDLDNMMMDWLAAHAVSFAVMVSKADRVSENHITNLARDLGGTVPEATPILLTSARSGRGIREIHAWITERLATYDNNAPTKAHWQITSPS